MKHDLALRTAADEDAAFLHHLYRATRAHEFGTLGPSVAESLLRMQSEARERQYRDAYPAAVDAIIELGGERVGRLFVDRSRDGVWRLIDIAVLPQRQRAGIGDAVLKGLLDEADRAACAVELNAVVASPAARWYERHHFREVAAGKVYVLMCRPPVGTVHQGEGRVTDGSPHGC